MVKQMCFTMNFLVLGWLREEISRLELNFVTVTAANAKSAGVNIKHSCYLSIQFITTFRELHIFYAIMAQFCQSSSKKIRKRQSFLIGIKRLFSIYFIHIHYQMILLLPIFCFCYYLEHFLPLYITQKQPNYRITKEITMAIIWQLWGNNFLTLLLEEKLEHKW